MHKTGQYAQLQKAVSHGNAYDNLYDLFKRSDDKYNSGLFDFKKDTISGKISIKNKVLKKIIEDLYYPSPYVFRVMPVEVLGNAYEQFLGKVIRITSSHSARIEVKPEVRKAGGVYYTPQYIVEYIVKNTVGKLIEGKTPKEIEKIKIVDPACGSGSFLIGAFQYLVNYHVDWYHHHPAEAKKAKALAPSLTEKKLGGLTTSEKKKILLNNIFGVDIDANAVEVTKLSLLLKCMEGETEASIKQQLSVFHERILPDLDNNIKSGNSLVDTDIYDNEMDFGFEKKIKPFNWKKGFPEVFKQGGFDAVIGNPPYVGRSTSFDDQEKEYVKNHYNTSEGKYELYQLFIERGTKIANPKNAFVSLITPQTWLSIIQATKLRKYLLNNFSFEEIVFLGKDVFNASVDTIIFLVKTGATNKSIIFKEGKNLLIKDATIPVREILIKYISTDDFIIPISTDENSSKIINRLLKGSVPLNELGNWWDGVKVVGKAKDFAFQNKQADKSFFPMYTGGDIEKYNLHWGGLYCCRDKNKIIKHNATDIRLREEDVFNRIKILIRKTGNKIIASIDDKNYYYEQSLFSFSLKDSSINLKLILAILNSSVGDYLLNANAFSKKETFPQIRLHWLKDFPIPNIKSQKKKLQDEIIKNVDLLSKLTEEKRKIKLQTKIEEIKHHIAHSEEKINHLIYELYNLTPEEIKIVEGKGKADAP